MTATKKQSKPAQIADEIESLGWTVQRVKHGELREIHASRDDELVAVCFRRVDVTGAAGGTRDVFEYGSYHRGDERTELSGAAEAMKIVRTPPAVPFALAAPDDEVLAAVAGKSIEWSSRLTDKTQSGHVPRGGVHLKLTSGETRNGPIAPEDRVLYFSDGRGFHAVRIGAIVKVS